VRAIYPSTVRVDDSHAGRPILELFCDRFTKIDRTTWVDRFRRGLVLVNGSPVSPQDVLSSGTEIKYYREIEKEPVIDTEFNILYEDDAIIVADKPFGLPTVPAGNYINRNLVTLLKQRQELDFLSAVYRLDKDTSGLVLLARTKETAADLSRQIVEKKLRKQYLALTNNWDRPMPCAIEGNIVRDRGGGNPLLSRVDPSGKPSRTVVVSAVQKGRAWLLDIELATGRQHQIRVHLASIGCPVIGDALYGDRARPGPLQLLCKGLTFAHPATNENMSIRSGMDLPLS
jgi:23S rRNA pseudouridine1911/1915/1917 synthase